MNSLVVELKKKNEDFEFYPTTDEIIFSLVRDLKSLKEKYEYRNRFSFTRLLDIGAGDGKVLYSVKKHFDYITMYAIEKAETLRNLIENDVYLIGTDFKEQSLLDKEVDVTFCNPPYSEYVEWTNKIIRESCSPYVYLVIPRRWKDNPEIKESLKYRNAKFDIIGEFSFEDAEDRKARAYVNLVRIKLSKDVEDAFDTFFAEEFKDLKAQFNDTWEETPRGSSDNSHRFNSLVIGDNYVKTLVQLYNNDIENIRKNYSYVQKLDGSLLAEFDIKPSKILKMLKERLKGLKKLYWNELIGRMDEITNRLTNKFRKQLLETLNKNGHVDFTESNIYAVVLWILKHASEYIDEQLIDVYENFITTANCRNYKSNKKVFEDDRWRYNDADKPSHLYLEYRLILRCWGAIGGSLRCDKNRLSDNACDHLKDLLTIANNLGFNCDSSDTRLVRYGDDNNWTPGKYQIFEFRGKGEKTEVLFEAKAHLNGNIHIRMNQKFALALNVEFGRLKGWVHSGKDAAEEMEEPKAEQYYKTNFALLKSPFLMLENK